MADTFARLTVTRVDRDGVTAKVTFADGDIFGGGAGHSGQDVYIPAPRGASKNGKPLVVVGQELLIVEGAKPAKAAKTEAVKVEEPKKHKYYSKE